MFLNIAVSDLENAVEPTVIETEEEVKLQVKDVKQDINKNEEPYMLITFEAVDFPTAKTFTKYYALPFEGMDSKKKNNASLSLRKFFQAFEVDYTSGQVDLDNLQGCEGWALLGVDKQEDSDFGPQNYIKRFVAGQ